MSSEISGAGGVGWTGASWRDGKNTEDGLFTYFFCVR